MPKKVMHQYSAETVSHLGGHGDINAVSSSPKWSGVQSMGRVNIARPLMVGEQSLKGHRQNGLTSGLNSVGRCREKVDTKTLEACQYLSPRNITVYDPCD